MEQRCLLFGTKQTRFVDQDASDHALSLGWYILNFRPT
jgi:hypothetical protein